MPIEFKVEKEAISVHESNFCLEFNKFYSNLFDSSGSGFNRLIYK